MYFFREEEEVCGGVRLSDRTGGRQQHGCYDQDQKNRLFFFYSSSYSPHSFLYSPLALLLLLLRGRQIE